MLSYFLYFSYSFFMPRWRCLCNDRNLSKDTIHFSISFWWLVPPLLCFCKIVFHSVQLRIPLISSLRNIYLRHAVYFYSKNSFSKNIYYVIHLIFKNGINNIFSSQTSFLLVSSNTHASFANKPIKFYRHKSNTGRHFFAVIIFIYDGIFLLSVFFPNSEGCKYVCSSLSTLRGHKLPTDKLHSCLMIFFH